MGEAQELATDGGGVACHIGKFLSRGSSGGAVVLRLDVGGIGVNGAEVGGS